MSISFFNELSSSICLNVQNACWNCAESCEVVCYEHRTHQRFKTFVNPRFWKLPEPNSSSFAHHCKASFISCIFISDRFSKNFFSSWNLIPSINQTISAAMNAWFELEGFLNSVFTKIGIVINDVLFLNFIKFSTEKVKSLQYFSICLNIYPKFVFILFTTDF